MLDERRTIDEAAGKMATTPEDKLSTPVPAAAPPARRAIAWLRTSARQLVAFCKAEPLWLAAMSVFVLAWTIELYVTQEITLIYPNETSPSFDFWAPKIRLALDLLFVLTLTFLLRRRWLCLVVAGGFFAYLGLITYFEYFLRPLSLLTIFGNWREGMRLSEFALDLFPKRVALMLILALATEWAALFVSRKASLPRNCAWLAGGICALLYVSLYLLANRYDPLDWIQKTRGVGRLGEIRGYLGPWFAEWYYLRDDAVLQRALQLREVRYDRLTPLEADIPVHKHLVILQAESLDFNVLGFKVDGVEVTPFLNKLRDQSMFYRVSAMHFNGSSDADFAALNAVSGSRHENPYIIPGYPYENTTPQFLARCGFSTFSFHGNGGEFYSRRRAFEQIGFAGIYFQEELENTEGLRANHWGVRDADVLSLSAQKLRMATTPTCHFVITLTTHVPYKLLADHENEIYPHPRTTVQNYLNNMRYLNNCLRDYIASLGSGTTVMIYADHPTEEGDGTFTPDRSGGREFIPCFIYDSDQNLSKLQKTRGQPIATEGTLNLVDMVNYLRAQAMRNHGQAAAKTSPLKTSPSKKGPSKTQNPNMQSPRDPNNLPSTPASLADQQRLADTVVLIPAAGRVAEGVMALSNIGCPAMVPVAGRPVIHWTLRYLRSLGLRRFVIAVSRRGMFVEDFVDCSFGQDCDISFIVPSSDGGVGRTVLELAEAAQGSSALVVLGDTHFRFADPKILLENEPAVLVQGVEDSYRWCIAETDDDGVVTALHDKQQGLTGPLQALIGVYYFPQLDELRDAARAAVAQSQAPGGRTELAQILGNVALSQPIRAVTAGDWLDCGNPDRQASSHRTLLQKREFNDLSIDSVFGTVTKRSRYVEKFLDEINYLRLLPPELAVFFPRVLEYSTDWQDPCLTLEYYGYPTLAEVFVFENVDPGIWEQVFVHLREILLQGFMRHRRPLAPGVLQEMYLNKTRTRLESMSAPDELLALVRHVGPVTINGREVPNIPALWERLETEVERLAENVQGSVVHGDLCLSNILYDLRSRICKLLDPRGSFGTAGIYGDPRYDVAKLYHSIYGLYDFITNDLFHVSIDGTKINLDIRSRPQHRQIQERFEKVFFAEFDRREILLITGLLFASMPALHYDAPRRQLAMYTRALELFGELFSPSYAEQPS